MKKSDGKIFEELAAGLKKGDKNALAGLFNYLKQDIYFFSYSYFKNKELSEEVVQEVFIRIWDKRDLINPQLCIRKYIFKIAKNLILDYLRKSSFEISYANDFQIATSSFHENTENQVVYADYQNLANHAIEMLPPKRKSIFKLSREENMTYYEISRELDISVNVVENQMSKSLKQIRKFLVVNTDIVFFTILSFILH